MTGLGVLDLDLGSQSGWQSLECCFSVIDGRFGVLDPGGRAWDARSGC